MKIGKKIILDTNIWVSYIIGKKLNNIAKLIIEHDLLIFSCEELEAELKEVLGRDKFLKLLHLEPEFYLDFIQSLTTTITISRKFQGCPDEKDNFLFDLAEQSQSEILVTGDKLLLGVKVDNIEVVSFKHFRESFEG